MAEQTLNDHTSESATSAKPDSRNKDFARMRRIGGWHATAVAAALALWGSADYWAVNSGLLLAHAVALGIAVATGTVLASILHEWGHFTGARLSGAISPVLAKPARLYFMFNFDMHNNTPTQFIAMSLGGIVTNWLLVLILLVLVPLSSLASALLLAVVIGKAVNVSFFEIPIVMQVRAGALPNDALQTRLKEYGLRQMPGLIVGALAFLAFT